MREKKLRINLRIIWIENLEEQEPRLDKKYWKKR